jgi:hypothetical protein
MNGGDVGVCQTPGPTSEGGTCVPEGDVCHYTAAPYACGVSSARADCCGPQTPKFTACVLDPLGVPRCNAYTGVGGDGGIGCVPTTGACSTAADCCNGGPCVPGANGQLQCGTSCRMAGQSCTANADCCAGLPCVAPPGSVQGVCTPLTPPPGTPPPSDAGTTSPDSGPSDAGTPGYGADGGFSCALFGQSCASLPCCSGTLCASGTCISAPR